LRSVGVAEVHEAIALVRARPELLSAFGPCPEDLIRQAEQRVGHVFPPSYRYFLSELGTASFGGEEIYGLIAGNLDGIGVPNALWLYENNLAGFAQPARYFEFYNYGDGTTVALDFSSRAPEGECALAETHAGAWDEHVEIVEGDFGSFFLDLVREVHNEDG
jgi:hypothetical protein